MRSLILLITIILITINITCGQVSSSGDINWDDPVYYDFL
jgi:hypothetical protein